MRRLRAEGACIIFTSHRWGEVRDLADRITIFRNGPTWPRASDIDEREAVTLMTGRDDRPDLPGAAPPAADAAPVLEVRGLRGARLHDISFTLQRGEILGIGGLAGQGQRELFLRCSAPSGDAAARSRSKASRRIRRPRDAIAPASASPWCPRTARPRA